MVRACMTWSAPSSGPCLCAVSSEGLCRWSLVPSGATGPLGLEGILELSDVPSATGVNPDVG